jgi:hypothetical protein
MPADPQLESIIEAWADLPAPVRAGILALVAATKKGAQ